MHTKQANTYNQRLAVGALLGKRNRNSLLAGVEDCVRYFDGSGITYFLHAEELGVVKIGCTGRGWGRRIQAIQGCCPVDLRLRLMVTGGEPLEKSLHYDFDDWRTRGEWFEADRSMEFFMTQLAYRYSAWVEERFGHIKRSTPLLERLIAGQNSMELQDLGIALPDFTLPTPARCAEES